MKWERVSLSFLNCRVIMGCCCGKLSKDKYVEWNNEFKRLDG